MSKTKPTAIIVDLDGTLCDTAHRAHHITPPDPRPEGWRKNWPAFTAGIPNDTPNRAVRAIIERFACRPRAEVILLTGRYNAQRDVTKEWLARHDISWTWLFMRPDSDHRHDYEVKREIYRECIAPVYDVLFVLEDRPSVCRMWRELGLVCLQLDDKEF